ncbi:MAG: DNA repair protein RadA [Ruminococcaceae bacterium]|nr:DNA repair protein RadA [Oscillospiraceae bacterium]
MKLKTVYTCSECGAQFPKWMGKCTACNSWNTIIEEVISEAPAKSRASVMSTPSSHTSVPKTIRDIDSTDEERTLTGMGELDRVLGGGLVSGSLVLVGGDPGIGKSTLLLQICETLGRTKKILYVSGEESQRQIKLRADRLGIITENLKIYSETNMSLVIDCVFRENPDILIVDSVQTMFNPEIQSTPGNITQIRDTASVLMKIAKENSISVFLVGHVTKEGSLAGPKVLEHIVDSVLYFEGDRHQSFRILRAVKNRFGSTNEIGVFEMSENGLQEIPNPSQAMLSGRPENVPGSCIICTMEGTRPVLAEVQALVSPTSFGNPRRMASGPDLSRSLMLMAVLEKRGGLRLSTYDAYVNIVGGLRITEPAADLGLALAIASSFTGTAIDSDTVAIGEIGLTGELRSCSFLEARIAECEKLGFRKCIVPASGTAKLKKFKNIEVCPFYDIKSVIDKFCK